MQATELDRETARALVEAGYMPLDEYVRLFSAPPATPPQRKVPADVGVMQIGAGGTRSVRGMKATLRPAVGWRATYR